jgi:hypothetical protein
MDLSQPHGGYCLHNPPDLAVLTHVNDFWQEYVKQMFWWVARGTKNPLYMPNDVLILIINQVPAREQLGMRPLCRKMRALNAGGAMVAHLAPLVFFQRPEGMRGVFQCVSL